MKICYNSIISLSEFKIMFILLYWVSRECRKTVCFVKNLTKNENSCKHVCLHNSFKKKLLDLFLSITATFIDWKWRFTKHFSSCFGKKTCPYCVIRFSSKSLNKLLYTRPGWINCKKIWCEALFFDFLFGGPFGQQKSSNAHVFLIINTPNFGILNVNRIWWRYVIIRLYF